MPSTLVLFTLDSRGNPSLGALSQCLIAPAPFGNFLYYLNSLEQANHETPLILPQGLSPCFYVILSINGQTCTFVSGCTFRILSSGVDGLRDP